MINIVANHADALNANRLRLPFYLAMEEWAARVLPPAEYFFSWRVNPTVIIGRNQDASKEVDLDYCRSHGIELYRRRSGGGCVYADMDNLMLSYITPSTDVTTTFTHYTSLISQMLRSLGIDASATGRNDVLVGSEKVSGNAFYHLPGRSIVHGTLLYDFDADTMSKAITPSRSKLESKGVKSVNSRVTSLKALLPSMDVAALERYINCYFCDTIYHLSDSEIAQVREIEQHYYSPHWIYGHISATQPSASQKKMQKRIEGVGELNALLQLADGLISDVELTGDFFVLSDLDTMLFDKIRGHEPTVEVLTEVLDGTDVSKVIAGLSTEQFVNLISC